MAKESNPTIEEYTVEEEAIVTGPRQFTYLGFCVQFT